MAQPRPTLRRLREDDDLVELTALLHAAYAPLAQAGMKFYASHQPVEATAQRAAKGECWVALVEGRLVGTITLIPPDRPGEIPLYEPPTVAVIGQFGVHPDCKGLGLGRALIDKAEERALALGAEEVALDTSEHAHALIALYTRRGYRQVGEADWRPTTNYLSVVLSKRLSAPQSSR